MDGDQNGDTIPCKFDFITHNWGGDNGGIIRMSIRDNGNIEFPYTSLLVSQPAFIYAPASDGKTLSRYVFPAIPSPSQWIDEPDGINFTAGHVRIDNYIYKESSPYLHNYNAGTIGSNLFLGKNSGNLALIYDHTYADPYSYQEVGNTGIGDSTLTHLTKGTANTALGYGSMQFNTDGSLNTAVGRWSLKQNTGSWSNVACGESSMQEHKSGGENCAIGTNAMMYDIDGTHNTAVGVNSMWNSAHTGLMNTAVGNSSLSSVTGSYNTALGTAAMAYTTTGQRNTSIGSNSQVQYQTGSYNSSLGMFSLQNRQGDYNVAIGYESGKNERGNNSVHIDCGVNGGDTALENIYIKYGKGYWNQEMVLKTIPIATSPAYVLVPDADNVISKAAFPTGSTYTAVSPIDVTGTVISVKSDTLTSWQTKQNEGVIAYNNMMGFGTDLVVNGGFDSDSNWNKGIGWSISGGKAVGTNTSDILFQTASFKGGRMYKISLDVEITSGWVSVYFCGTTTAAGQIYEPGHYVYFLVYNCSYNYITIDGAAFTGTIDNFVIKPITN
jgi:hypothetical protein